MTLQTYLWQLPSTGRAGYILKTAAKTTYTNKILKSIEVIRVQTHFCLLQFHSFSIFFGLKNKTFSSGLLLWNWIRKIKWLNWKVILCWNKCYYTYESLSFLFPSTLFENVHKKQQRDKMVNEISKIHLHQKVDDRQRKKLQSTYNTSKIQSVSFSLLSGFSQMSAKPLTEKEK